MSETNDVDYGPLSKFIGVWKGDKGIDIAPDPEGTEENPYYETFTFTEAGSLKNADFQELAVLYYRRTVTRKSDDKVFHDETGYWLWDAREKLIVHSLSIPRAVCLLAGAHLTSLEDKDGNLNIEVAAGYDNKNWGIVQSPFMQKNAKTLSYRQKLTVGNGRMSYLETSMLDIYGREFEHTDQNELRLV